MTDTVVSAESAETTETTDRPGALSTQPAAPQRSLTGRFPTPRQLWRQLTSMRTALLLLTLLALAAIPGTVIPQRGLDSVKVDQFLTNHPHLGPFMNHLSLFDVFAAPWFAAIYLLLFVSLVGCLVPRIRLHAKAMIKRPPNAPRSLMRMPASTQWETEESAEDFTKRVHALLRRRHWRADVRTEPDGVMTVAAEKGYLRETGNLVFHVSLVVLLVGIALAGLYGYKGTTLVVDGGGFANSREAYDVFAPSRLFSDSQLSPFSFTMQKFEATYTPTGQPLTFNANIHYKSSPTAPSKPYDIRVNHPLNVPGAKVFLVGHGYALNLTITNAKGQVVSSGDTAFLPDDAGFGEHGVVKVPNLGAGRLDQLGLTGSFYPSYVDTPAGPTSTGPTLANPVVVLSAFKGDLGLRSGNPEPDYSLNVANLTQIGLDKALTKGESWKLADGATVRFNGVDQWATFQVAHEPGKRTVLLAAVLIIAGLLGSLRVRRRRFWVRAVPGAADEGDRRTVVTAAGLARSDVGGFVDELDDLVGQIGRPPAGTPTPATERD